MLENVSIIIPFQTDNGPRAEAFEWIKKYYARVMPEAELCIGIYNGEDINKSKAVNLAVKMATRDIFVIADADVVYDPNIIIEAIKLLGEAAMVVPFNEIYNIPKKVVKNLYNTQSKWPLEVKLEGLQKENWIYKGFAGKLNVIPRVNFEAAGGFDERFIGWGGEDDAFSLAVQTLCGKFVNVEGKIFHLWHPRSSYKTNSNGKANGNLLNRYKRASGNKKKMIKLIEERSNDIQKIQPNKHDTLTNNEYDFMKSPKSKICFSILVHKDRELVKQLIDNVRYYCPNSAFVLYNGGNDPTLCDGLGVPVCPSSHKLERGYTTNYFLETMEWIEELGIQYEYFINIDSDALFIRNGYEEFIQKEMEDTDYMAVKLRIPEKNWYIGKELKKDIDRWKRLFNVDPFYGVFNVGQVISKPLVRALLEPERKKVLKKALLETISFGTDEILFVNMAKELGFRLKKYPSSTDSKMIRYRPYFTLNEMLDCLNNIQNSWLCHPVIRDKADPVRKLIFQMESEEYTKRYKNTEYPWYESDLNNYALSLPIKSKFGNLELIVRSDGSLTHYWQNADGKWLKTETFAKGVTGTPLFYENNSNQFGVVCRLKTGGVAFWWRDNKVKGNPWYGPSLILNESVDPIMFSQLKDGSHILVCKSGDQFVYWIKGEKDWKKNALLNE